MQKHTASIVAHDIVKSTMFHLNCAKIIFEKYDNEHPDNKEHSELNSKINKQMEGLTPLFKQGQNLEEDYLRNHAKVKSTIGIIRKASSVISKLIPEYKDVGDKDDREGTLSEAGLSKINAGLNFATAALTSPNMQDFIEEYPKERKIIYSPIAITMKTPNNKTDTQSSQHGGAISPNAKQSAILEK